MGLARHHGGRCLVQFMMRQPLTTLLLPLVLRFATDDAVTVWQRERARREAQSLSLVRVELSA